MLSLYDAFIQIVEQETLVRAAMALHVTQPTVTRQLQQLEQQIGMPLFDRVGKRLSLNRAGEVVYTYAKQQLALQDKMKDELNHLTDPDVGVVYLGAGLSPSIYLLPSILAAYRESHPQVTFHVRTGSSKETITSLRQREIDVGIVTTFPSDCIDIEANPLWEDDVLLVSPPQHPLAAAGSCTLQEALQMPMVVMRSGSGLRQMVSSFADTVDTPLTIGMETDSLESIIRLVQHGVGLAFVPRSAIRDDVEAGRLTMITVLDAELGRRTIRLVRRKDTVLPACTEQFVQHVLNWTNGIGG